jgi:hypothetical protein
MIPSIINQLLVRMHNGMAILEDSLAVSYKMIHIFVIWVKNCSSWYLLNKIENLYPKRRHKQDEWTDKLCYIHMMEYYLVI